MKKNYFNYVYSFLFVCTGLFVYPSHATFDRYLPELIQKGYPPFLLSPSGVSKIPYKYEYFTIDLIIAKAPPLVPLTKVCLSITPATLNIKKDTPFLIPTNVNTSMLSKLLKASKQYPTRTYSSTPMFYRREPHSYIPSSSNKIGKKYPAYIYLSKSMHRESPFSSPHGVDVGTHFIISMDKEDPPLPMPMPEVGRKTFNTHSLISIDREDPPLPMPMPMPEVGRKSLAYFLKSTKEPFSPEECIQHLEPDFSAKDEYFKKAPVDKVIKAPSTYSLTLVDKKIKYIPITKIEYSRYTYLLTPESEYEKPNLITTPPIMLMFENPYLKLEKLYIK